LEKEVRESGISKGGGVKYITINTTKGNANHVAWMNEMRHIKSKGVGAYTNGMFLKDERGKPQTYENLNEMYSSVVNYLFSFGTRSKYDTMHFGVGLESYVLHSLKQNYLDFVRGPYNYLASLNVYHMASYISKFCQSLHYYSVCSLNRNHIMVDKIAPGALLIVKGGNKIYKSNRSRWYRLFFPVDKAYLDMFYPNGCSHTRLFLNGQDYLATPWMNMHETILVDGMFLCHRLTSVTLTSVINSTMDYKNVIMDLHMHICLMFHQRRTTEKTLHDLRYVLMNCFS
jgi:hypothetical protein